MYQVSVTARGITLGPNPCTDLDEAVDVLREGLIGAVTPGRRVMWIVHCPSGRVVRGDITINTASTDRSETVREHVTEIRDILTADTRPPHESPGMNDEE